MPRKVIETWWPFDTAKIFTGAKDAPIEYPSFTALADADDGIDFFSTRTSSDIGKAYTNQTKVDNLGRPLWLESVGIRFHHPNPVKEDPASVAKVHSAKIFMSEIVNHAYFEFKTEQDVRLWLKPLMASPGYGVMGNWITLVPAIYSAGELESGWPVQGNRAKFIGKVLEIPSTTRVTVTVTFSDHGKQLLRALDPLGDWDFLPNAIPSMALIECSLRGKEAFEQRGDYTAAGSGGGGE